MIKAYYEGRPEEFSYREIDIHVRPAWYAGIWAWIAYILIAATAVMLGINGHRRKIALKAQKEESEMKEMKLEMFANISHEIRTPLTLVMTPLKKMREHERDQEKK